VDGQALRRGLLAAWFAAVLLVTLAPFWPLRAVPKGFAVASRLGPPDFALNVILFLPAGVLLRLLGRSASSCTAAGALLSLAIESAQMWIPHRHPSQLDILANALGALAGALVVQVMTQRRKGAKSTHGDTEAQSGTRSEGETRWRRRLPAAP
jgi:VanZ family protein